MLPGLRELYLGGTRRPRIHFYSGPEAQYEVDEGLLNVKSGEYFYFGSVQEMFQRNTEEYLAEFYRRRIARGIWSNAIRNPSKEIPLDYMQPGPENLAPRPLPPRADQRRHRRTLSL